MHHLANNYPLRFIESLKNWQDNFENYNEAYDKNLFLLYDYKTPLFCFILSLFLIIAYNIPLLKKYK